MPEISICSCSNTVWMAILNWPLAESTAAGLAAGRIPSYSLLEPGKPAICFF